VSETPPPIEPPNETTTLKESGTTAEYLNAELLWDTHSVYDFDAFTGNDPYDFFLRGAEPIVILSNLNSTTDRELILFRDSFSSSLAPLLSESYRKVTLIDLRYINFSSLENNIHFNPTSDVLFLYSSQILNNPESLRVVMRPR
jgi:hypothetical protein